MVAVINHAGDQKMHDLTIATVHTYYVYAGDSPVLVHNCNIDYRTIRHGQRNGVRAFSIAVTSAEENKTTSE